MAIKNVTINKSASIVVLFTLLLLFSLITVLYEITNKRGDIIVAVKNLQRIEQSETSRVSLTNLLNNTKEERAKIDSYFIKSAEETITFLENLEALALALGIEFDISSVDVVDVSGIEESSKLMVVGVAEGSFEDIYNFINFAERLQFEIVVSGGDIRLADATAEDRTWKGDIKLEVLSYDVGRK